MELPFRYSNEKTLQKIVIPHIKLNTIKNKNQTAKKPRTGQLNYVRQYSHVPDKVVDSRDG